MNLTTRCPNCGTAFRVQPAQLSARGGKVRCGKCANVFDGVAALVAEGAASQNTAAETEPSPQLALFEASRKTPLVGASDAANEDVPVAGFLDDEESRPRRRFAWAFGALLALAALAAQAAFYFRTDITAWIPETRPYLAAACVKLKCDVRLPRRPKLMAIESSDLQADGRRESVIVLNAVLRNQAPFAQEYPSLELTLTDERDEAVARRVLLPADYLAGAAKGQIALGLGAGADVALRVFIDTSGLRAVGYRMYLFFHDREAPILKTLVTGSIAYDTIMVFPDRFRNHLLADQLHILNVCFLTPEMRREFGGTAGNIAYNLKLLEDAPLLMATVGDDIAPYLERLQQLGISAGLLKRVSGQFTAQAFITTDLDNNQIIAFHPGAMNHSHENRIGPELGATLAIVGPDGKEGMQQHSRQCAVHGIPLVFDPGQGLPMFSGEELMEMVKLASYLAVNDYEGKLLEEKTGKKLEELARNLKALVLTLGGQGSVIFAGGKRHEIPCVAADAVLDPTGCGDAYRAGLLYGISHGWDWPSTGRLASVMGSIKIAHRGAQNHAPSRDEIAARYRKAFGSSPL